tara:strand:+ start:9848 stop:10132 length:285 start_codon:yes stop_codon:yes gene_type:complete
MTDTNDNVDTADIRTQVEKVVEMMRPAIQSDGGDIEVVAVSDEGMVQVRFHGACVGCPSSTMTLKSGIERNLKTYVPGIMEVVAVDMDGNPVQD